MQICAFNQSGQTVNIYTLVMWLAIYVLKTSLLTKNSKTLNKMAHNYNSCIADEKSTNARFGSESEISI